MAETIYERSDPRTPEEYYASLQGAQGSLESKFKNIDDKVHFMDYMQRLKNPLTRSFVLDFGNDVAYCATDLNTGDFRGLLTGQRAKCFGTRWIHIWNPEQQKDTIQTITSKYGVSERLQGMMYTEPFHAPPPAITAPNPVRKVKRVSAQTIDLELDDIENGSAMTKKYQSASFEGLTFGQVTDQIWHFSSVDYGPRYTCVGYNTLFVAPGVPVENGKDLPEGTRLWSWLILCDDGTLISIQENPLPQIHTLTEDEQAAVLDVASRNIRFIFSGISKQHANKSQSESLVTIRVRNFHETGPDQVIIKQEDGPSLLFYYLFDDWVSSFGLIAKRQHKYGVSLEELRGQMLERPMVDLVDELHWLGRRLGVLKRLYQSYELIMRRLLQRQRLLRDEARSSNPPPMPYGNTFADSDFSDLRQGSIVSEGNRFATNDKPVGVALSSAAVARFERLVDRINLYCLSEIDTCLLEKESLTFLNFNLIALKDSQAVEKLTRITILLAKATMLFLPVSLMTAYFSTELKGVKGIYTQAEYWVAFTVIFVVTVLVLTIFGFASDTVEGKTIYRSLVKTFFRRSRQRITGRAKRED
ncbi:uncharacterized protein N7473_010486 [Penicillium subrubescens]|uniref:uncharacterized protein n=1 Tax=Penicillium subrubescens TaxID=1316194 RepID=UPI00254556E8|nr:uncharacterized protein N7473_010486 [Penicillium subrubescens]KAJ5883600.1 hypothetical protein N7473_010486 [Penicillium subrubescens]